MASIADFSRRAAQAATTSAQQVAALLRSHADHSHSLLSHINSAAGGDRAKAAQAVRSYGPALDAHAQASGSLGDILSRLHGNPQSLVQGGNTLTRLLQGYSNAANGVASSFADHGIPTVTSESAAPPDGPRALGRAVAQAMGSDADTVDHGHPALNALQQGADVSHGLAGLLDGLQPGEPVPPAVASAIGAHGSVLSGLGSMVGSGAAQPGLPGTPSPAATAPTPASQPTMPQTGNAPAPSTVQVGHWNLPGAPNPSPTPAGGATQPTTRIGHWNIPAPGSAGSQAAPAADFTRRVAGATSAIQGAGGDVTRTRATTDEA